MKIKAHPFIFAFYFLLLSGAALPLALAAEKMVEPVMDQALSHKNIGDRMLEEGNAQSAIKEYEASLSLNPRITATYFNLAIAQHSIGETLKAVQSLESLLYLDNSDAEAHYHLGWFNVDLQDYDKARFHFNKSKTLSNKPDFIPHVEDALHFLDEKLKKDSLAAFLKQNGISFSPPQN